MAVNRGKLSQLQPNLLRECYAIFTGFAADRGTTCAGWHACTGSYQVSMHERFLWIREGGGGTDPKPAIIHRRDSEGSITSSNSK
jgi:hypothetical protein